MKTIKFCSGADEKVKHYRGIDILEIKCAKA